MSAGWLNDAIGEENMNRLMTIIMDLISVVSMIAGIVLSLRAMWLRTVKEPKFPSMEPKFGIPFWKMKPYFSPKEYRTYVAGTVLIMLGCLLMVIKYWLM
jgi:hypothetical protein